MAVIRFLVSALLMAAIVSGLWVLIRGGRKPRRPTVLEPEQLLAELESQANRKRWQQGKPVVPPAEERSKVSERPKV